MSEQTPDAFREVAQKMEQERTFREREGITPQHSLEFSAQLQSAMKTYYEARPGYFSKERVGKIAGNFIAGYLDTRFDHQHEQVLLAHLVAGKERDHYELLDKEILPTYGKRGYEVQQEGEYFQITPRGWSESVKKNPTFTTTRGEKAAIQYKEYFTFVPLSKDADGLLGETKSFHEALLDAHEKIQRLADERGWNIPMKFSADIRQLITNMDSLVMYVPDPKAGQEIRGIVEETMKQRGIRLGGSGRTRSGFDVTYPDGTQASHRQLISQATSKWIEHDYAGARQLPRLRKEEIAQQLFVRVRTHGKMEPSLLAQTARV